MQCVRRIFCPGRRLLLSKPVIPHHRTRLLSTRSQPNSSFAKRITWVVAGGGGAVVAAALTWASLNRGRHSRHLQSVACATEKQHPPNGSPPPPRPGDVVEGLPDYTLDEVSKHVTRDDSVGGVWVTYRDGVYDITEFAGQHPGGDEKILLARGGAIDPFWEVFPVHATEETLNLLETMRIGNICAEDRAKRAAAQTNKKKEGPFANDPTRSPLLKVITSEPFNAETPAAFLVDGYTTPTDVFYVRNHLPVPEVDPSNYALEVSGEGLPSPIRLTLNDLKTKFEQHTVVATLQCTGNRRSDLQAVKPIKGLAWSAGAIGNAEWSGVRVRDVLIYAGLKDADFEGHVHFEGLDRNSATGECYGASVPAHTVLDPHGDVLLAYAMNGADLTRDHGYPLRVVVPGVTGARNVKWLGKVRTSREEYGGFWQQRDYKSFSPAVDWDNVDFSKAPAIQETPIQSAICSPQEGFVLPPGAGEVTLRGYAYSGGGRGIIRVDVSADGGKTWHEARLREGAGQDPYRAWAWVVWEASVPFPVAAVTTEVVVGTPLEKVGVRQELVEVCCRAVDRSYNTQPEFPGPIWNLRGVLANSWHRIHLRRPLATIEDSPRQQRLVSPEVR